MKLKNHIDWIKNKSDICLTKARWRERRGSERLTAAKELKWNFHRNQIRLRRTITVANH